MAANSKHHGDVYIWINKVIESCTSYKHIIATRALIRNFTNLYTEFELSMKLYRAIENKYDALLKTK